MRLTNWKKRIVFLFVSLLFCQFLIAQNKDNDLEQRIIKLEDRIPGLRDTIGISVENLSLQSFLVAVMKETDVNLSISTSIKHQITNNFSKVSIRDLVLFLCKEYNLDFSVTGNILTLREIPTNKEPEKTVSGKKRLGIVYNATTGGLQLDLYRDTLRHVVREISRQSGKNILLQPNLNKTLVSCYIQQMDFIAAMQGLALSNNLELSNQDTGYLYLYLPVAQNGESVLDEQNEPVPSFSKKKKGFQQKVVDGKVSISTEDVVINDIIESVSSEMGVNYFIISPILSKISITCTDVDYDTFLGLMLQGTGYTFRKIDNNYLIGPIEEKGLNKYEVIPLKYRSVDKISEILPSDLKSELEIIEYGDLNSLIAIGQEAKIKDLKDLLFSMDRVAPVILIEVLIVDVSKSKSFASGINAGLGNAPEKSTGSFLPNPDLNLSTKSINNLIDGLNGFGWVKLGKVTPEFYLSIKALEEDGILKLRSTPMLSTINGYEATLSVGKTEYYLEENNSVIGTQNPQNITTRTYKPVSADLSVTIKPIVTENEQIILDIKVAQSDFTARISPDAPPGAVTRDFQSLIRVKNQEMILLGGLEESSTSKTGSGVPLLSRIPVIKFFFGSRSKVDSDSKLNIFIKPTIIN